LVEMAARDARVFARVLAGDPYPLIIAQLACNAYGWRPIEAHQGIHSAALRHADRHGLPKPAPQRTRKPAAQRGG
jgi:hypothetical protein